jgi:C1A family cysteine protease
MGTSKIGRKYGWKPDLPHAKRESARFNGAGVALPPSVDLRSGFPAVYDQGQCGSCTANALAGVMEFDLIRQALPTFTPSRLFIYWNERYLEGSTASDSGATISDGVKAINTWGAPPEKDWLYLPADQLTIRPPKKVYADATKTKALTYASINQNIAEMKACLAIGFPFVFGFSVFESFESDAVAKSGIVPMPQPPGEQSIGGHAVVAVGYTDSGVVNGVTVAPPQTFIVRNSWGAAWGVQGYAFFPYAYLTSDTLASDFWKVTSVS